MIYRPKNHAELKEHILKTKPKVVVYAGRHEPSEPSLRLIKTKVGGKELHEHFKPEDILFAAVPLDYRIIPFYSRIADQFAEMAKSLKKGKSPHPAFKGYSEKSRKGIGRFLEDINQGRFSALHLGIGGLPRRTYGLEHISGKKIVHTLKEALSVNSHPPTDFEIADFMKKELPDSQFITIHFHDKPLSRYNLENIDEFLEPLSPGNYPNATFTEFAFYKLQSVKDEPKLMRALSAISMIVDSKFSKQKIRQISPGYFIAVDVEHAKEINKKHYAPLLKKHLESLLKNP